MASSPRTAYCASRTFWFILLRLRLRREFVVDMARVVRRAAVSGRGQLEPVTVGQKALCSSRELRELFYNSSVESVCAESRSST